MTRISSLLALLITAAALGGFREPVDAFAKRSIPVWLDAEGRVIAQMVRPGILYLYTRDQAGRVVRVQAQTGNFNLKSKTIPSGGTAVWVHVFEYDERGHLTRELDCLGNVHELGTPNCLEVDPVRGTAIPDHRHGGEPQGPSDRPARRVATFEYDEEGRILKRDTKEARND